MKEHDHVSRRCVGTLIHLSGAAGLGRSEHSRASPARLADRAVPAVTVDDDHFDGRRAGGRGTCRARPGCRRGDAEGAADRRADVALLVLRNSEFERTFVIDPTAGYFRDAARISGFSSTYKRRNHNRVPHAEARARLQVNRRDFLPSRVGARPALAARRTARSAGALRMTWRLLRRTDPAIASLGP